MPGGDHDSDFRIGRLAPPTEPGAVNAIDPVTSTTGVSGTAGATEVDRIESLAAALGTGAIAPVEAQNLLIEAALQAQLPPNIDPVLLQQIHAEVQAMLALDPTLRALLEP